MRALTRCACASATSTRTCSSRSVRSSSSTMNSPPPDVEVDIAQRMGLDLARSTALGDDRLLGSNREQGDPA
ncbi:hypothetical protein [Piscinibacter sp. XHJ-5]|uniref:hypothetical protein n=1 Tax=Piscinibacter sp. XHJ-5 TaxID=3037797 RepID=UPI0024536C31|nr:hypothetical protein [Piscinibacter sp. XHJ-5]